MTAARSHEQDGALIGPRTPEAKGITRGGALHEAGASATVVALDGAALNGAAYLIGSGAEGAERPDVPPVAGQTSQPTPFLAVAADLTAVETAIQETAAVDHPLLQQTLRLILSAGGKRLRPALVLLAAGLHRNTLERRVALAVAAELLHTATLVHDDVLDLSDARRGRPTINAAFGNSLAVLTGDFLFGKSGELVASLGSPPIMGVFSWAVMELVKGEMLRPSLDQGLVAAEQAYFAKIRGKTASLLAMCCQTGAMLDADDPELAIELRDYGLNLGMAFQIVDDVLDYTATEEQLGKPVGSDLRQGTLTLPAICYLRGQPQNPLVRGLLSHEDAPQCDALEAVAAVRASGAIEQALAQANTFAAMAATHLRALPSSPQRDALHDLTRYVVARRE